MTYDELIKADQAAGERQGWDFSFMKTERDPIPWQYQEVVKTYLKLTDYVLDIGTGGGEIFIKLASFYSRGVGIDVDPEMIGTSNKNLHDNLKDKITFKVMSADFLDFPDNTFDMVINRQAPMNVVEIKKVLKPNSYFITQHVGVKNMQNIKEAFGFKNSTSNPSQLPEQVVKDFQSNGFSVVAVCEYNVNYYVKDIASLVFWLKALRSHGHAQPTVPEDFTIEKYWKNVDELWTQFSTSKGFLTNEHRHLLVVKKN